MQTLLEGCQLATQKCADLFDAIYNSDCLKPEAKRAVLLVVRTWCSFLGNMLELQRELQSVCGFCQKFKYFI